MLRLRLAIFFGLLTVALIIVWRFAQPQQPRPQPSELPPLWGTPLEPAPADAAPLPPFRAPGAPASSLIGEVPAELIARRLTLPVKGVTAHVLTPQFYDARGERGHEALDIMAPLGRPVLAVEGGTIAKLHTSEAGGLAIYQFDPSRTYAYYYAHLNAWAPGLAEGQTVRRGQVIGTVGQTGNATTPHLHFGISRLAADKTWWGGEALDPYPVLRGGR